LADAAARIGAALATVVVACACAAPAQAIPWDRGGAIPPSRTPAPVLPDRDCLESYANDRPAGGPRVRFGIGPRPAGEGGVGQTVPTVPEKADKRDAALRRLQGRQFLAVRLNRLFMDDGRPGILRFQRMARHYARMGLEVELQVRYHPAPVDDGDIGGWLRYVRRVVREFGPIRRVTGLQITNEVNIAFSPNTSDGAFRRSLEALIKGVVAAKRESHRLGHDHQQIGFNFAWRFATDADTRFWEELGRRGGGRLRRHTDWVGIDIYPGTFAPGLFFPTTIVDFGDAFLEGIAQTRECYMPKAGFGLRVPLRIEETGYGTGPGRSEAVQAIATGAFARAAHRYRGTYNISDFRFFGLRDNNSEGPSFQQHFGLLRDDYSEKPAFEVFRRAIARYGAPPVSDTPSDPRDGRRPEPRPCSASSRAGSRRCR
jgi:hypothetical protein